MYVEAVAESCWDVFRLAGRCLLNRITLRGVRLDVRALCNMSNQNILRLQHCSRQAAEAAEGDPQL